MLESFVTYVASNDFSQSVACLFTVVAEFSWNRVFSFDEIQYADAGRLSGAVLFGVMSEGTLPRPGSPWFFCAIF